jgi:phosphoglycerol transferase MdoB-like AlkP superfamily enzyme
LRRLLAWPAAVLSLVALNASLTFANVWPTPRIRWQSALSIELAVCVLLLALLPRPAASTALRVLPAIWLLLIVGHYLDVTAPGLYGRDFNLYWDAPHVGNVVAMIAEAAPGWQIALVVIAAVLLLVLAYVACRAAWGWVHDAVTRTPGGMTLAPLAAVVIALFTWQRATAAEPPAIVFADPVAGEYVHQIRSVLAMLGPAAVTPGLGPSPDALATAPDGLAGADVHLVFVESYGAITFDDPELAAALAPSRTAFEAAVHETGRTVVSAFVESPTFGGSSWLAHLSLLSGIGVRDPYSYQSLMTQQRETLSTTFARAGYRSVALMPGMRQAWPEGAFYCYATIYGRDSLSYNGPRFGWWSIPDQYSLARLDAIEGPPDSRSPLFVVFPTSTTHAPFGPVAPYQPDWSKVLTPEAYDPAEVERILARPPDLTNLAADYAHAMSYEFTTFAGYLRQRAGHALVMILIGDHQPPAAVSGQNAEWTVPIHVVSDRPQVIDRLLGRGFRRGLTPVRPSLSEMHELVPILLAAFR